VKMVPKERFELSRPYGHYALNPAPHSKHTLITEPPDLI